MLLLVIGLGFAHDLPPWLIVLLVLALLTCRGTSMTGGSSGGPWIANYGTNAVLNGVNYGNNANRNIILVGGLCRLLMCSALPQNTLHTLSQSQLLC